MEENSNWIEKFKRISWEPEILISGGMLFTLFQAQSSLGQIRNFFYPLHIKGSNIVLGFIALSISALTIGFIFHLITKAFWIALLALKSVFPEGIKNEKLGYAEKFLNRTMIDSSLNSKISVVGNTSSLLFTISFLFLLIFLGIAIYLIFWICIFSIFNLTSFFEIIMLVLLILPFIDFISLGSLKKSRIISIIYYPNYKFISWITLSFLYRDVLYTIFSNFSKKRIYIFSLFFMVLSSLLTYRNASSFTNASTAFHDWSYFDNTYSNTVVENNYENLRTPGSRVTRATIQSDIISDDHVKLYIRYLNSFDQELDEIQIGNPDLSQKALLNKYLKVKVDSITIDSISWFYTRKSDLNQYGIIGYFPIDRFTRGSHLIEIRTNQDEWIFTIPFWKE